MAESPIRVNVFRSHEEIVNKCGKVCPRFSVILNNITVGWRTAARTLSVASIGGVCIRTLSYFEVYLQCLGVGCRIQSSRDTTQG